MANLNEYLNEAMLSDAVVSPNDISILKLRQNVPYHFQQFVDIEVVPNLNAVISRANNSIAAATVMNFDAEGIEQSRGSVSNIIMEKLPIVHSRGMKEKEIANLEHVLKLAPQNATNIIAKQLYDDVTDNKSAIYERFEFMVLQLMSNQGKMQLTATNNVDGVVTVLDYGISDDHKVQAATKWATTGSADPVKDIEDLVDTANAEGLYPDTVFMTKAQFKAMTATDAFKALYVKTIGAGVQSSLIGIDQANEAFRLVGLPQIFIITDAVKVRNSSNSMVAANAWNTDYVSLGIAGKIGKISSATPPSSMFEGKTDVVFATDEDGIITTVISSIDPMYIKTTSKVFALPIIPEIYNMFYLEIDF